MAKKMNLTYDFYLKHTMQMFEWQLKNISNRDKKLKFKLPRDWALYIARKFQSYCN